MKNIMSKITGVIHNSFNSVKARIATWYSKRAEKLLAKARKFSSDTSDPASSENNVADNAANFSSGTSDSASGATSPASNTTAPSTSTATKYKVCRHKRLKSREVYLNCGFAPSFFKAVILLLIIFILRDKFPEAAAQLDGVYDFIETVVVPFLEWGCAFVKQCLTIALEQLNGLLEYLNLEGLKEFFLLK